MASSWLSSSAVIAAVLLLVGCSDDPDVSSSPVIELEVREFSAYLQGDPLEARILEPDDSTFRTGQEVEALVAPPVDPSPYNWATLDGVEISGSDGGLIAVTAGCPRYQEDFGSSCGAELLIIETQHARAGVYSFARGLSPASGKVQINLVLAATPPSSTP